MAKKVAKKSAKKAVKHSSFTFKGDDLEIVTHALSFLADIASDMVDDTGLTMEERGCAAFDAQHCRDILKRMEGKGL